jgi:phospholipase C
MSIQDENGNEIIHLNSVWSASFKLLMLMVPFFALTLFSWGTWVTITIFDHHAQLSIIADRHNRADTRYELPNTTASRAPEPQKTKPN